MNIRNRIRHDIPLAGFNTFGIAVDAQTYLAVESVDALSSLRADPELAALPRLVLGGGSNLLLTRDFPGLVLHMRNTGVDVVGETADAVLVRAAAGESWHGLVDRTLADGFGGLENLALIPGSVGAAPIQNIGAYGVELAQRFHALTAFDFATGELLQLDRDACRFGYRDSVFKHTLRDRTVIVDVTFALPKAWRPELHYADVAQELAARGIDAPGPRDVRDAVVAIRTRKLPDPAVIGNAGSFFKNPVVDAAQRDALIAAHPDLVSHHQPDGRYKLAAGWLIDRCGWKGRQIGAAGVYDRQALVLVNRGGATGDDVLRLARAIQDDVQTRFGVALEPEPVVV